MWLPAGSLWQRSKHKLVLLTEKSAPQSAGRRCGGEAWEAEGSGAGRRVVIGGVRRRRCIRCRCRPPAAPDRRRRRRAGPALDDTSALTAGSPFR